MPPKFKSIKDHSFKELLHLFEECVIIKQELKEDVVYNTEEVKNEIISRYSKLADIIIEKNNKANDESS